MITTTLAAESSAGNPILNISIFGIFLFITMAVVLRAGKTTKKASDFYTGGGTFSGYMPSTGFFFPKRLSGTALNLQAGIGNLGRAVEAGLIDALDEATGLIDRDLTGDALCGGWAARAARSFVISSATGGCRNTGRPKVASVMKMSQGIGTKGGQVGSARRL